MMKKSTTARISDKDKKFHRLRLTKFLVSGFDRDTSKFTVISTNRY